MCCIAWFVHRINAGQMKFEMPFKAYTNTNTAARDNDEKRAHQLLVASKWCTHCTRIPTNAKYTLKHTRPPTSLEYLNIHK